MCSFQYKTLTAVERELNWRNEMGQSKYKKMGMPTCLRPLGRVIQRLAGDPSQVIRLTLGQARQEELLEYLFKNCDDADRLKELFINLSPFYKEQKKG